MSLLYDSKYVYGSDECDSVGGSYVVEYVVTGPSFGPVFRDCGDTGGSLMAYYIDIGVLMAPAYDGSFGGLGPVDEGHRAVECRSVVIS